jgi:exopolysaccharide biosynthesis polyprenyl glycosylphosphotransferase
VSRRALLGWRILSDAAMAAGAVGVAYYLRFRFPAHPYIPSVEPPEPRHYQLAALVTAAVVIAAFAVLDVYRHRRGTEFIDELFSLIKGVAASGLVLLALIGAYRVPGFDSYSRLTLAYWLPISLVMIGLARYGLRRYQARQRSRGRGADRAVVVGSGVAADLVIQRIRMFPDYGYQLVGIVADELKEGSEFAGIQVLGGTADLPRIVRNRRVGVVFMALPDVSQDRVLHLMDTCDGAGAEFRIVPSMLELMTTQVTADQLDGIPLLQFRHGLDIDGPKILLKRAFDAVVAAVGLVVLSPLLLLIGLLVRLTSPGPVLLRQERVGLHGTRFHMLKYRTMRADAEEDTGPVWAAEDDPRRTRLGRVLRRFSLDELPQLWNIVVGEMSLVGPRPERPVFVSEFNERLPRYADRHQVRPGLTGWAQVNDLRGQTDVQERLLYDLYYIESWSLQFDLKILLITLVRIFTHKNAY